MGGRLHVGMSTRVSKCPRVKATLGITKSIEKRVFSGLDVGGLQSIVHEMELRLLGGQYPRKAR